MLAGILIAPWCNGESLARTVKECDPLLFSASAIVLLLICASVTLGNSVVALEVQEFENDLAMLC